MTENTLQLVSFLKLIFISGCAFLYGCGGISGKWKRRIIVPILLTIGIGGFSLWQETFSYWYILCALLFWGAYSIGYGADKTWLKVVKRSYCGLAYACASLPIVIVRQTWELFALHIVLCLIISIWLGVRNPLHARNEESLIGFVSVLMPLFML